MNLLPLVVAPGGFGSDLAFDFLSPFAAAGDEWINVDQQGELFEALAEFSHCRRSSFRRRGPA